MKTEYLHRARNVIKDENNWCQHANAKDKDGNTITDPVNKKAIQFCGAGVYFKVGGAIMKGDEMHDEYFCLRQAAKEVISSSGRKDAPSRLAISLQ